MKANILVIALTYLTTTLIISHSCYSQKWGGAESTGLFTSWSVNINGGLTSYFGDLSLHDLDVGAKIKTESGPALSLILTKSIFKDAIGLSGQILTGKLEGRKNNISFTAELVEYNVQARIDFVDLIMSKRNHAFGIVGYAGAGQFLFKTKKVVIEERTAQFFEHDARVPEFVFFFGGGLYYKVNSNFGITADLALRQCENDRLDDFVKNDDYDYYSYVSIGLSYYINTFKRSPLKNKARLANSSFRFRSPAHPAHDLIAE
jgi:hypothetical protein